MGQLWRDEWRSSSCSRQQTTRDYWTLSAVLCSLISPNANCEVSGHCWSLAATRLLTGLANSYLFTPTTPSLITRFKSAFWSQTSFENLQKLNLLKWLVWVCYERFYLYQMVITNTLIQNKSATTQKFQEFVLLH